MKNIDTVTALDDVGNYKRLVKGSRKPQKISFVTHEVAVEGKLNNYQNSILHGTAVPLGLRGIESDHHYHLYDSQSAAVAKLKSDLADEFNGHSCPYCNLDTVETIDHFFPRAAFPELSMSLQNLVMSCYACNTKLKKEHWGNGATQEIIHPRYNLLPNQLFLEATVNYVHSSLITNFTIVQNLPLSGLIQRNFIKLNLNERYKAKVSLTEVSKMKLILQDETTAQGKLDRLTGFVRDKVTSNSVNTWEHAFYTAVNRLVPVIANGGL